ncbi:hypothetical protein [Tahibacter caeni]|uniref:hypothetical protein n=1 Tax=Tahibacter caeni TaxID=1453545 RepID=UPI002148D89B|nr:hypothetical protein [Tahibacter caeni]
MKRPGIAAGVLVLVFVLVWWLRPSAKPVPPPAAPPVTQASPAPAAPAPAIRPAATAPAPAIKVAASPPPPLPEDLRSARRLSDVFDQLLRRAESGDVAAMAALGTRLVPCEQASLRRLREQLRDDADSPGNAVTSAAATANYERRLGGQHNDIADCEAVPGPLRDGGLDWLERAAATGYGEAQVAYADAVFDQFTQLDDDEAVARIEDYRRRRDLARRFLAEAVAHCATRALFTQYYWGELLFDPRDERAYAINLGAATDAVARIDVEQGLPATARQERQRQFDARLQKFDEAARAEARRRGEAQFKLCAGH